MTRSKTLLGIAALWVAAAPSFAGMADSVAENNTPGRTGAAAPPASKEESKLPAWLELGGQIRGRLESPSGTGLTNTNSDTYYLSRIRVDVGVRPFSWLRLYAEGQDTRVAGYLTSPAPNTIYNPIDLRQGFVELKKQIYGIKWKATAGRQELRFGGERLIGPADWGISRTFDAVDATVERGRVKADFIAGSAVLIDPTRFDRHKSGEHLYGVYGSVATPFSGLTIEPYLLFKQTLNVKGEIALLGDALIATPGFRAVGKAPGRFDYTVEVAIQKGSYSSDRVSALAASAVAGWTLNGSALQPRLSAEYNYASGDSNPKDGSRGTFDQLYPSNHAYYGMIDQFGWKNMRNVRAGFDFKAIRKLKIRADLNEFFLATTQDGLYNSSGTQAVLNRSATSSHIGAELNTVALYSWSKMWQFGGGYGHLFQGAYLKQSKNDFGYSYPYLMFIGKF